MNHGKVSLTRHAGRRSTALVEDQMIAHIGRNDTTVGFDVTMPDGSTLHVRLDNWLVGALYDAVKYRQAS